MLPHPDAPLAGRVAPSWPQCRRCGGWSLFEQGGRLIYEDNTFGADSANAPVLRAAASADPPLRFGAAHTRPHGKRLALSLVRQHRQAEASDALKRARALGQR